LHKLTFALAAFATAALSPVAANAGSKQDRVVTVGETSPGYGYANGVMSTAANSPDVYQRIACGVQHWGSTFVVWCSAADASNKTLSCSTFDTSYIQMLSAITSESYLAFSADPTGTCTSLSVEANSSFSPKR
jgi:hypothetical protein